MRPATATVDEYIASCPPDARAILKKIRATAKSAAPKADERISYRMPALFQDGVVIYYAAFKKHIGIFPPVRDEKLKAAVARYAGPKGNLQLPLDEPIPYALVARIVKARLRENLSSAKASQKAKRRG